jgi:hypothetical protein
MAKLTGFVIENMVDFLSIWKKNAYLIFLGMPKKTNAKNYFISFAKNMRIQINIYF